MKISSVKYRWIFLIKILTITYTFLKRYKKQIAELTVQKLESEQLTIDLQNLLSNVQSQRDNFEKEIVNVQRQSQHDKNTIQQISDQNHELEGRLISSNKELERLRSEIDKCAIDSRVSNEKILALEKQCASMELELKAIHKRYNQEIREYEKSEKSRLAKTNVEANLEIVKALQTKLNDEKGARQKADLNFQEKERQISMLSVDYRLLQQRLQKLEGLFSLVLFIC